MDNTVQCIFKEIVRYINDPRAEIEDIEYYLYKMVKDFFCEYEPCIKEWVSSHTKGNFGSINHADSFLFQQHRIVVGYSYLHELGSYVNIRVVVMKDLPTTNLSIRKAMFIYNIQEGKMVQVDNEISKP